MDFVIVTPYGPAACRVCSGSATVMRWSPSHRETLYYCEEHNPDGPPCPLCSGSGRIQILPA